MQTDYLSLSVFALNWMDDVYVFKPRLMRRQLQNRDRFRPNLTFLQCNQSDSCSLNMVKPCAYS